MQNCIDCHNIRIVNKAGRCYECWQCALGKLLAEMDRTLSVTLDKLTPLL